MSIQQILMIIAVVLPLVLAGALFRYPAQALGLVGIALMFAGGFSALAQPPALLNTAAILLVIGGLAFCGLAGALQTIEYAIRNR